MPAETDPASAPTTASSTAAARAPRASKTARPRKPKPAAPDGAAAPEVPYTITFRARGKPEPIGSVTTTDRELYRHAKQWNYILRNRGRLAGAGREELQDRFEAFFENETRRQLGRQFLAAAAEACVVEVAIPWDLKAGELVGWAARTFPWETALGLATKRRRGNRMLTVVRCLDLKPAAPAIVPEKLLFVQSAPAGLQGFYDFRIEQELVQTALACASGEPVVDPDRKSLLEVVQDAGADVVHVSAVDAHQAGWLLPESGIAGRRDGVVFRAGPAPRGARKGAGADSSHSSIYDTVDAAELAALLCPAGGVAPRLVGFNCYFSAARLAPHAIVAGAHHALGFQDAIDDVASEQFFAAFYSAWRAGGFQNPVDALITARERLAGGAPSNRNAAIVLWSAQSLVADRSTWASSKSGTTVPAVSYTRGTGDGAGSPGDFKVLIRPLPTLNYSLLHNDRDLFDRFEVYKLCPESRPDLDVEVRLHAGEMDFPFRVRCPLKAGVDIVDLRRLVRVPLLASLLRGCHESLRTSLFIEIRSGEQVLARATHPISLLPADEWRDDDHDRCWLPAFVLPRDGAVLKIVGAAQRYLRALADDAGEGFDGYQRPQPAIVDRQVQALWCALSYEIPLGYINPPPTYTRASQRIRTPGQILEARQGTCIDLALLFASCLEYVGIFPVVFLIRGHAFPGYWRDWQSRDELFRFQALPERTRRPREKITEDEIRLRATTEDADVRMQREPWMFEGEDVLAEIRKFVEDGTLVPFESTLVTAQGSFTRALSEGPRHLDPLTFDAMLDIQAARDHGVTPLPLV